MNHEYRLPAEWEPQSFVQLTWPHIGTDWADMLDEINEVYVRMAREIAKREQLLVVTPFPKDVQELLGDLDNVCYFQCPTDDTWARDHGFITLVRERREERGERRENTDGGKRREERGERRENTDGGKRREERGERRESDCKLLDFHFNGWGEKFPADKDNSINVKLWGGGPLYGLGDYENHDDFVLEGGSIESDGRGTVFTTSQCLLAPHRNQPMTQAEIEERLKRSLGADRIVWLDYGNLVGDDTDGHIDTIVRCAPDDTLLYIGCDDPDDEQFENFQQLERQLQSLRTADGKPYRLLRLPMPDAIYHERGERREERGERRENTDGGERILTEERGERLPATHANFLIINGAVLVPTYNQPTKDEQAMRIIGEAFPGRDIIGIDSRAIIKQHGSIHCCTMQFPAELDREILPT